MDIKVKSKVLSFGFFLSVSACLFGISATVWAFLMLILNNGAGESLGEGTSFIIIVWFLFVTILCASIPGKLLWDSSILEIDKEKRIIRFTNRFTRISKEYPFNYFDKSVIIMEPIKGGYARNCYLLKNNKAIKRLNGLIYSNQLELESAIEDIKSMGIADYSHWNSARILFNKEISLNIREPYNPQ